MAESEGKKEESPQTRNEKKKKLSLKYTLKETAGLEFVFLIILRRGKRDNLVPEKVGSLRKPQPPNTVTVQENSSKLSRRTAQPNPICTQSCGR